MQQYSATSRSDGIDFLKGFLILLVIIGHIVVGSVHDNEIRYSIHAFHMPLFIGLTGYLLNANSLTSSPFLTVFTRYWWRLIVPFSLAFTFFTGILFFHAYQEGRVTIGLLLSYLHTPYYHLWFIPTMMLWVLIYRMMLKSPVPMWLFVMVFSVVSLYWGSVSKSEQFAALSPFVNKKVFYFFSFFLFGASLRNSVDQIRQLFQQFRWFFAATLVVAFIVYLHHIGFEKSLARSIAWFALNMILIGLVVPPLMSTHINSHQVNTVIVNMGRNSLPIYLWHVLPLFLLKGFDIHQNHVTLYYCCAVIANIAIVWLVLRLENVTKTSNRIFYGT